ncbi:hypothetical protein PAXRUDRAFT_824283 [Paxillus rubicundulus Ve08.2h10]|uniref:BTB domain-containing protein n=1 Tax=Paxillus rubicundulus Ve08.2h10 TaxID=930991 RepID=A0A0D0DUM7_9AGAM|nr:hypothetical protein PAXRUDRAFT_824283 [Paxillus rubicundulus Ve08.2h10]
MSPDNTSFSQGDKVSSPRPKCPPELKSLPTRPAHPTSNTSPPSQFTTRPFPPPALADVPVEYIMDQLHSLAPHYWNRPETADCTIVIPVPHHLSPSPDSPASSSRSSADSSIRFSVNPNGTGRRATASSIDVAPRLTLQLHMDYLSAKSSFFRGLFSGASPLDLIQSLHISARRSSTPLRVPQNRLPRLLPSTTSHPVVFLPVPDPSSIHLLFHWMYFGSTDHIESCLDQGTIQWEGLARNVEYLGLSTEIKVFLGRWYGNWLLPARYHQGCTLCAADDDSDAELECDDQDDDDDDDDDDVETDYDDYFSTSSSQDSHAPEECKRGRTQVVRPLARLCGQLQRCTA